MGIVSNLAKTLTPTPLEFKDELIGFSKIKVIVALQALILTNNQYFCTTYDNFEANV